RKSIADSLGVEKFVLLTMHRAENVDKQVTLEGLVNGLLDLEMDIIFAAHPRTVSRLKAFDLLTKIEASGRIHIIEPPGYLDFLRLMESCTFVLTDSGGIQEEVTAPSLNKSVFVLRTSTERHEAVESGHATIVGVNPDEFTVKIQDAIKQGLDNHRPCPYGEGDASIKILDALEKELQ
ncbi:MAG: UDP-N-acetylglucosamine 2-epimerase, partial [Candidatus Thorarchaeota archaeon]